jgi:hypothetical protein
LRPRITSTVAGTSAATSAGATVWAKKYSIVSMSWLASAIKSPERPPHQIGRRQRVELAVKIDPHLGEQPVGDVVRQPRFDPVQDAGERRSRPSRISSTANGAPS